MEFHVAQCFVLFCFFGQKINKNFGLGVAKKKKKWTKTAIKLGNSM